MPLVNSLLTAIVRANGDALVLHAGERPYVIAPSGQVELASRALTLEAVKGMLNELLPVEARQALDDIGAVQHELGSPAFAPGQTFSVVAARGGEDIWIEIRRHRAVAPEPVPEPVPGARPSKLRNRSIRSPNRCRARARRRTGAGTVEPGTLVLQPPRSNQIEEVKQESYDIGTAADVHEISLDASEAPLAEQVEAVELSATPSECRRRARDLARCLEPALPRPTSTAPTRRPCTRTGTGTGTGTSTRGRASALTPTGPWRSERALHAVAARDGHRSPAPHRRRARRVDAVSHLAGASVHSRRRRDRADRGGERLERGGRRDADSRHGSRAQPRSASQPGRNRVDVRRARGRANPLRDLPRSSRRRRHLPHDSRARDFCRAARAVARDSGAVRRSRWARACDRPALERQVDPYLCVRRSHQPHAQRSRHHHREPDQVRAREPRLARQPARSARRSQRAVIGGARGAAREPRRARGRGLRLAGNRRRSRSRRRSRAIS